MYSCSKCGHQMSYPLDRCPSCHVLLSGVRCQGCSYVGGKNEFISNNHRCPKCGSYVSVPSGYEKMTLKGWLITIGVILAIAGVIIFIVISEENSKKLISQDDALLKEYASVKEEVTIGNQVWMGKNLDVDRYRNGDVIPEVTDKDEWSKLSTGAWCYYENKTENGKICGKLYNWYAVNDPRGLAPEGWHIPSDKEWTQLTDYLGGEKIAGKKLKSTTGWKKNGNGTNENGFTAFPGGGRDNFGGFGGVGYGGSFWSSSGSVSNSAWNRSLGYYGSDVPRDDGSKSLGFSIRCVRD